MFEPPRVVGHRGAAGHAPENTLGGLARAAELGCRWVEFDVQISRDGVPVLMHDSDLRRTTGYEGLVRDTHSRRIAELDAGSWFGPEWRGETVPTLAQALDACRVLGLLPNIEIKYDCGALRACARAVAATVAERWPAELPPPLVSSFSRRALYFARMAGPHLPLALLLWQKPVRFWTWHARLLRCRAVHVDPTLLDDRLLARARRRGLATAVYTINDPAVAAALYGRGVDYLFSDRPDVVADAAGALPADC